MNIGYALLLDLFLVLASTLKAIAEIVDLAFLFARITVTISFASCHPFLVINTSQATKGKLSAIHFFSCF